MKKSKLIVGLIIIMSIAFLGFQVFQLETLSELVRFPIVPLVAYLYATSTNDTKSYFFKFLLFFAIGELLGGIGMLYYITQSDFIDYIQFYGGNICYITAYFFLVLEVYKNLDIKQIVKRFPVHIIILLALDIYSVVFVSDLAVKSGFLSGPTDYIIEVVYNIVIMTLLTIALINYINQDSKKAMNLLVGALCIVFSEVFQVAYYYVADRNILCIAYSILLILAFVFFYLQSGMKYTKTKDYKTYKKLEEA